MNMTNNKKNNPDESNLLVKYDSLQPNSYLIRTLAFWNFFHICALIFNNTILGVEPICSSMYVIYGNSEIVEMTLVNQ